MAATNETEKLEKLREILLYKDRELLSQLNQIIHDTEELEQFVGPIMEARLEVFKQQFPEEYEKVVKELIREEFFRSKDKLLDAIYPTMGQMIRKYVSLQITMLRERIDKQVNAAIRKLNFWQRLKNRFYGVSDSEMILSSIDHYQIEEIFVIERDSGLYLGHASAQEAVDQDVIAGMFTAIKSFVEDAFKRESQELESIDYGNYQIFIHNFRTYYIAAAISGMMSASQKVELEEAFRSFAAAEIPLDAKSESSQIDQLSQQLYQTFIQPSKDQ